MIATALIELVIKWAALTRTWHRTGARLDFRIRQEEALSALRFASPIFAGALIGGPAIWAANAMLASAPNGYAEMGVYNAALQWTKISSLLPSFLAGVALSVVSNLQESTPGHQVQRVRRNLFLTTAAISILVNAVLLALSPWVLHLYGRDFRGHAGVVAIVLVSSIFSNLSGMGAVLLVTAGRQVVTLASLAFGAATLIAVMSWSKQYGAVGRGIASLASELAALISLGLWLISRRKTALDGAVAADP